MHQFHNLFLLYYSHYFFSALYSKLILTACKYTRTIYVLFIVEYDNNAYYKLINYLIFNPNTAIVFVIQLKK